MLSSVFFSFSEPIAESITIAEPEVERSETHAHTAWSYPRSDRITRLPGITTPM